ncbi:unnamed protein product, partial [Discosporangium mesarthrocarpum]
SFWQYPFGGSFPKKEGCINGWDSGWISQNKHKPLHMPPPSRERAKAHVHIGEAPSDLSVARCNAVPTHTLETFDTQKIKLRKGMNPSLSRSDPALVPRGTAADHYLDANANTNPHSY